MIIRKAANRKISIVGFVLYPEGIGRYLEGECHGGFRELSDMIHTRRQKPMGWLENIESMKTLCNKLGVMDLLEQSWLQLMCCTICLPYSCNFR